MVDWTGLVVSSGHGANLANPCPFPASCAQLISTLHFDGRDLVCFLHKFLISDRLLYIMLLFFTKMLMLNAQVFP